MMNIQELCIMQVVKAVVVVEAVVVNWRIGVENEHLEAKRNKVKWMQGKVLCWGVCEPLIVQVKKWVLQDGGGLAYSVDDAAHYFKAEKPGYEVR